MTLLPTLIVPSFSMAPLPALIEAVRPSTVMPLNG